MSERYSRVGRPRPVGGGRELAVWLTVRYTGLALFVLALAHFTMTHFVFDPADQTAEWIAQTRWNSIALRLLDWSMLTAVLFHAFLGMRTVIGDYAPRRLRRVSIGVLYLLAGALFVIGTHVVLTLPLRGA